MPENYQPGNWFFSDLLTWEQVEEGWEYFLKSPDFENIPPLVDPERFNDIFGAYPVHFVTNIPPDCLERRQRNLEKVGYRFSSAHCAGLVQYDGHPAQTKAELIQDLLEDNEGFMFVDDHPDNIRGAKKSGITSHWFSPKDDGESLKNEVLKFIETRP